MVSNSLYYHKINNVCYLLMLSIANGRLFNWKNPPKQFSESNYLFDFLLLPLDLFFNDLLIYLNFEKYALTLFFMIIFIIFCI